MTVLALDLETIPDTRLGREAWGLQGDDAAVRQGMVERRLKDTDGRSSFFAPAFHRVVAVGTARYDTNGTGMTFHASALARGDEKALLRSVVAQFDGRPQVVTWNGGGFDFAVLRHRCLHHGVSLEKVYGPRPRGADDYGYRFGNAHVDLMDVLSGYGAAPRCTLHDVAVLAGLPGKTGDGADVERLVQEEQWDELGAYVQDDAVMTLLLFLRWEATCGRLPPEPFLKAREHFSLAPARAGDARE